VQCSTAQCSAAQHSTVQCSRMQHSTVQCSAVQHSTAQCSVCVSRLYIFSIVLDSICRFLCILSCRIMEIQTTDVDTTSKRTPLHCFYLMTIVYKLEYNYYYIIIMLKSCWQSTIIFLVYWSKFRLIKCVNYCRSLVVWCNVCRITIIKCW